jgi:hypothetical protein
VNRSSDKELINQLFRDAIGELNSKWNNKRIDDFPVRSQGVFDHEASPLINHEQWHKYLMDNEQHFDEVKNRKILFLLDHAVKTKDLLYFAHCCFFDRIFCSHCSKLSPSIMMQEVHKKFGLLPIPIKSSSNPGMMSFSDLLSLLSYS